MTRSPMFQTAVVTQEPADPTVVQADPSNLEQLRAWDGDTGDFWAAHAERFDEGVAGYQAHFLAAARIDTTANVLDIGCGAGQTTRDVARRASAGSTLGVDLSSRMIELARRLAEREQVANATFQQADAQNHPFPDRFFDIAISRSGAMFFGDAPAAFANIARAVRPGGHLVLLAWQPFDQNEWLRAFRTALAAGRDLPAPPPGSPGPFSLSDPDRVRRLLTSAGFLDVRLQSLTEPMYFGPDPDDACRFIAGQQAGMLHDLDADARARALDALRADMTDHQTDRGVLYDSAAWLIEARRG
jgi:SAM-dependent methyltransferase